MTKNLSSTKNTEFNKDYKELKELIISQKQGEARKKGEYLLKKYPNNHGLEQTMATIYLNQGEIDKSLGMLEKIVNEKNDDEYTHYFLFIIHVKKNNFLKSLDSFSKALGINKDFEEIYKLFFSHLSTLKDIDYSALSENKIKKFILHGVKNYLVPMRNAKIFIQNIILEDLKQYKESILKGELTNFKSIYLSSEDKIFLEYYLKRTIITNPFLEELITSIRSNILKEFNNKENSNSQNDKLESAISAIFQQSYLNGHIWLSTKNDKIILNNLIEDTKSRINNKEKVKFLDIAIIGTFCNLNENIEIKNYFIKEFRNEKKDFFNEIRVFFNELDDDRKNLKNIKRGKLIEENTSKKLEKFYDDNFSLPWGRVNTEGEIEFLEYLKINIKPYDILGKKEFSKSPKVLYAGCGSGRDALLLNPAKNSEIDVIDISLKNLLYAQKKTVEHNIKNINFYHLDYLNIETLNKKYDVIIVNKILNQIDDFNYGLKIMLDHLNIGGFAQIILKSPVANKEIDIAREKIGLMTKNNIKGNDLISDIREYLIKSNDEDFNRIKSMPAFFDRRSLNRLLNPMYKSLPDIKEIEKIISINKLEFIGWGNFVKNRTLKEALVDLYAQNFKDDFLRKNLDNWDTFEKENPIIFSDVYNFWIRKV